MRILALNHNQKQVGTYIRAFHICREFARMGHEVTLVTVSRSDKFRTRSYFKKDYVTEHAAPEGEGPWFRVIEMPCLGYRWLPGWGSGPLDILERTARIARGRWDVVYGFEYQPNVSWPVYLTRPFCRYTFLSDWCDWFAGGSNSLRGWRWAHAVDAFFEERIRFLAKRVTVISKTLFDRALRIGIPAERILHLPEGIDTDYLQPFPKEEVRTRLGLPLDRPIVTAVRHGSMEREVRVFSLVLRRIPEAILVVVGSGMSRGRALAETLGVSGSIRWAGWAADDDYPRYLAAADACFLPLPDRFPGSYASFPAKILDYLAAGRPVVSNDVGEVGSLIRSENVGLLAGQDDEAIADAICRLLGDRELRERLGRKAREVMLAKWDWRHRDRILAEALSAD